MKIRVSRSTPAASSISTISDAYDEGDSEPGYLSSSNSLRNSLNGRLIGFAPYASFKTAP